MAFKDHLIQCWLLRLRQAMSPPMWLEVLLTDSNTKWQTLMDGQSSVMWVTYSHRLPHLHLLPQSM